jgi:hypothetical protein
MVIDRDNWEEKNLSDIATKCHQAGYRIADSNPCFELWLLLHFVDFDDHYSEDAKQKLQQNPKVSNNRRLLEKELIQYAGSHNKSNLDTDVYLPLIDTAIKHAQTLDTNPEHRWMHSAGSRIYLLVQSIKNIK